MAALTVTLLPLGILAMLVAIRNYRAANLETLGLLEMLAIGAPILMWLGALLIGWLVASALIVQPLTRMRLNVDRYTAGDDAVRLAGQRFLSREIASLATAFDKMADAITLHDAATAAALAEQQRLTREVHHRVKNNLQIVSSLLSLQARDATSAEAAHAYAIVQSRVAALAVVHRWMYEASAPSGEAGIDLRALATDLCAGLEQSLVLSEHLEVALHCEIGPIYVGQDTAVPLAFLITELVSCAARMTTPNPLSATIAATHAGNHATLQITAASFVGADCLAHVTGQSVSRIVHGMARQLRSPLRFDAAAGCYAIDFPVVDAATG